MYENNPQIKIINPKLPIPEAKELALCKKEGYDLFYSDLKSTMFESKHSVKGATNQNLASNITENKTNHQENNKYSQKFDFNFTKQFLKMQKDTKLLCCWFEVRNNQKIDQKYYIM